jgi:hypothetical protein
VHFVRPVYCLPFSAHARSQRSTPAQRQFPNEGGQILYENSTAHSDAKMKNARPNYIDFTFLAIWLVVSLGLAVISLRLFGMDFRGYYAAARVLLAGGNPYDYHAVSAILLEVTGKMGNNPYYYPPWFAWPFVPLTLFPYQTARWIWMAISLLLWNISLWRLGVLVTWPHPGWKRYFFFLLSTLSFAWIVWRYEQAGILVFAILLAAILSAQKQKWTEMGIWLALSLIKPNVTLIATAGIALWMIRKGQKRPVLVMVITILILFAISTLITPNWFEPFFEPGFGRGLTVATDGPEKIVLGRMNTTLMDWLSTINIQDNLRLILYGISICVAIISFGIAIIGSQSLLEITSRCLLISYAVTPYALQYDYPPLVIPLFWALSLPAPSKTSTRWKILLAGFVFSVNIWQQSISYGYWIVIGLIALTLYALYQAKMESKSSESFTCSYPP